MLTLRFTCTARRHEGRPWGRRQLARATRHGSPRSAPRARPAARPALRAPPARPGSDAWTDFAQSKRRRNKLPEKEIFRRHRPWRFMHNPKKRMRLRLRLTLSFVFRTVRTPLLTTLRLHYIRCAYCMSRVHRVRLYASSDRPRQIDNVAPHGITRPGAGIEDARRLCVRHVHAARAATRRLLRHRRSAQSAPRSARQRI